VVFDVFKLLNCSSTEEVGNRMVEMLQGTSEYGTHGTVQLSVVKGAEKLSLNIVTLVRGSLISSPLVVFNEPPIVRGCKMELVYK